MLRRSFIVGLSGASIFASQGLAQATIRTIVEVASADTSAMQRALNIVLETGRYHIAHRESAEIRVIAIGEGLMMLRSDISPLKDRVIFIMRSIPIAKWFADAEEIAAVAASTGAAPPLIPGVTPVAEARRETARLGSEGWSVIRP